MTKQQKKDMQAAAMKDFHSTPDEPQICNTCFCEFGDGEDNVRYQSLKNKGWLATYENGKVVKECCQACAEECEEEAAYN